MNKKILIGAAVFILIVGGLFLMNKDNGVMNGPDAMMENAADDGDGGFGTMTGGIKELIAKGKAMQCDFEQTADTGTTSGTVYISGNDMRGDFELVQEGGTTITSHMIRKGDTSYVWSSEFEEGFKSLIPEGTYEEGQNYEKAAGQTDPFAELEDQNVTYDCKPWIVNATMFTPPSDIEFVDLAAQMQHLQGGEGAESMKSIQCSACDQAPDAASQEQCKKAIGCN